MKRCPACGRTYDEVNAFCLADGTRLESDALAATVRVEPGEQRAAPAKSPNYNDPVADQPTARQQGWTPAPQPGQAPTVTWQQLQQQQPPPAGPPSWENQSAMGVGGTSYAGAARGALSPENRIALASAVAGIGTLALALYVLFSLLD